MEVVRKKTVTVTLGTVQPGTVFEVGEGVFIRVCDDDTACGYARVARLRDGYVKLIPVSREVGIVAGKFVEE